MTFTVSSFDLSHGSQTKVATKSSLALQSSIAKHAVLFCLGQQAEDLVLCPPIVFASGLPHHVVQHWQWS